VNKARLFRVEGKIGSIEVGEWGDIIAVDGHLDEDTNILTERDNLKSVVKRGKY